MQKSLRTLTALAACVFTVLTPALAAAAPAATQGSSVLDLNLPALGSAGSETLSPADEYRLGTQLMTRVRADPTYLNDPEISEYLGRLGYQLVSHAHTSTYNFEFFAIRDETLNAFALPGGYIAMHTGTIIAAQSESELAGVLAHEISHVAQRHIARMIEGQRSNLAITLGSVLLAILAARAGGSSGGNAAAAIAMGSQAAMIQSQLNYSQTPSEKLTVWALPRSIPLGSTRTAWRTSSRDCNRPTAITARLHRLTSQPIRSLLNVWLTWKTARVKFLPACISTRLISN